MPEVEFIEAKSSHIWWIAAHMRHADVLEVQAGGYSPVSALRQSLKMSSKAWTVMVDGRPCLMFGVAPVSVLAGIGAPWLLGTNDAVRIRRSFITESKRFVDEMLKAYPRLENYVDARNIKSIRWLTWLGFTIKTAEPLGLNGEMFHPFELKAAEESINV